MTDEIAIADYDPRWPQRFALEAARIRSVLAEPLLEIEHHGSTAVPGLAAKPVIDMLVAVESIARAVRYAAVLVDSGYEAVDPRYREIWPERIVLVRREQGRRTCHVHLMLRGHPMWERLLAFRDHLRARHEVAAEYAELKRSLANAYGADRHAYMSAKSEFINRITAIAMRLLANVLVGLVALSHVGILVLEMFFWDHPVGRRIFGMTPEVSASSATLAANQGLYNGFLAAGLVWALWAGRRELKIFFLGCVIVAGIFGGFTAKTSILFTQALPAAIALAAVPASSRR